jgi:hypothetical protein
LELQHEELSANPQLLREFDNAQTPARPGGPGSSSRPSRDFMIIDASQPARAPMMVYPSQPTLVTVVERAKISVTAKFAVIAYTYRHGVGPVRRMT